MSNINRIPSKEIVEWLRIRYPVGCRVELMEMSDPYTALKPGEQGVVDFIDSTGTIFVKWNSGSGLGVVYGVDRIKRVD